MSSTLLRVQHTSLQFSDRPGQQRDDIRAVFEEGRDYPIKTGTEAGYDKHGNNQNAYFLKEFARAHDHVIHIFRANWVAIDRSIIMPRTLVRGSLTLVDNDEMATHGHDRALAWLEFDHVDPRVGHISQGATHYAVKGRRPGDPNYRVNRQMARKLDRWFAQQGAGKNLAFLNADFNMLDQRPGQDWAFGGNFTSMGDELGKHPNTGHGPIDGFCSYDRDGRVSAAEIESDNDREFHMHTDHYRLRGAWKIQHLRLPKEES